MGYRAKQQHTWFDILPALKDGDSYGAQCSALPH